MKPGNLALSAPPRIYLDVSCLNRPFDDQMQPRIHEEAEAILRILDYVQRGTLAHVTSDAVRMELDALRDAHKRADLEALLPAGENRSSLSRRAFKRAHELGQWGIKLADGLHIAAAEE